MHQCGHLSDERRLMMKQLAPERARHPAVLE